MKYICFASDAFALEPLGALLKSAHEMVRFVGRPDARAGRGLLPGSTAAVEAARQHSLPMIQPENLTRQCFAGQIEDLDWDAGIVVAYGGLIPAWLLEMPRHGFVNLHPSLLPRYRGAAPVQRAIMNGTSITGVTTILLNERLDAGDILLHLEVPIEDDDSTGTLDARLSHAGAKLLVETLDRLERGEVSPVKQEEDKATYAPPIKPQEGEIDWSAPSESIDRLIRAMDPEPGAYTFFRGKRVKIWTAHVTDVPPEDEPGTIMDLGKEGFIVNTGSTGLQVAIVQPEGKKKMGAAEFSRGQRLLVAESFSPSSVK
jgi:methionyl-tRNA formyltransferase